MRLHSGNTKDARRIVNQGSSGRLCQECEEVLQHGLPQGALPCSKGKASRPRCRRAAAACASVSGSGSGKGSRPEWAGVQGGPGPRGHWPRPRYAAVQRCPAGGRDQSRRQAA